MRCDRDRLGDSLTLLSLDATLSLAMNLAKRKLGLMVSTGPEHANLDTALGLGRAARVQGLAERGARLFVCACGCQKRRLPLSDKATNCGLVVLADIVNATDRF